MKIAMVNTMYPPRSYGGAERVVQLLAEGLVRAGHVVVVICTAPAKDATEREYRGVRVREIPLANLYWPYGPKGSVRGLEALWHAIDLRNPVMAKRLAGVIEEEAPDIVHTHGLVGFSFGAWPRLANLHLPIVHTLHDHRLECVRAAMFKHGRACRSRCVSCRAAGVVKRGPAENVDLVVGVSRSVLRSHKSSGFFANAETAVIPVPLDDAPPPAPPMPRTSVRLGYLGRIHPGKGIETLLEATRGFPAGGWSLHIAGTGERRYVERLEATPRHPDVRFVGHVDPTPFLDGLDVLVMPSQLMESAGLGIVEALSRGVPVVAARRGGMIELIDEGQTGWLFQPEATDELGDLLTRIVAREEPLAAMRAACIAASGRHLVGVVTDAYVGLYERLLTRRSRDR